MSQQLVGTQKVDSSEKLRSLIRSVANEQPYYSFLRWAHKVSGIVLDVGTEFPSPEGQVFGKQFELRWKRASTGYEVLLLHCEKPVTELDFTPVADHWTVSKPLGAYLFDHDETRFPKGLTYPDDFQLRQRYFQDQRTATIHFVALTYLSTKG